MNNKMKMVLATVLAAAAGIAHAAFGDVDCSFGVAGSQSLPKSFGGVFEFIPQADGTLLARSGDVGTGSQPFRIDADGHTATPLLAAALGNGVADPVTTVLADGSLLTASGARTPAGIQKSRPDGSVDLTFGVNGYAGLAGFTYAGSRPLVQPDGRIVVGGHYGDYPWTAAIARFNPDGSPDLTFGIGGIIVDGAAGQVYPSIALAADGSIVAMSQTMIAHHLADGRSDTRFGASGVVSLSASGVRGRQVRVQPDGNIIVLGNNSGGSLRIVRFTASGSPAGSVDVQAPDGSFLFADDVSAVPLTMLPDGRMLIAAGNWVLRYKADLSLEQRAKFALPILVAFPLPDGRMMVGRTVPLPTVNTDVPRVWRLLGETSAQTCTPTTVTLTSSPNPSAPGETVTLTATVTSPTGAPSSGVVDIRGQGVSGSVAIVNGVATFVTNLLPLGTLQLTASYAGTDGFASGQSPPLTHVVAGPVALASVSSSPSPSHLGEPVTVEVTVAAPGAATPTGFVTVVDGSAFVGSVALVNGRASIVTTALAMGQHVLSAFYGGDGHFPATTAPFIVHVVNGPSVRIDDPSVSEGPDGTTLLGFTVSLSGPSPGGVSVNYNTANGSAVAGVDYLSQSGRLTFGPGVDKRWVLVPVLGNTVAQSNRTFTVTLSNAIGAAIVKAQGTGTILDDDPTPPATAMSQYRLYSPITREHLYTTDANEYAVLGTRGWAQEGVAYKMFGNAGVYGGIYSVPLYRFYHGASAQHLWTADANEAMALAGVEQWGYEGIAGYVLRSPAPGSVPLYRLAYVSPALHLWTTDLNEKDTLVARFGWIYEGIVGEVLP